MRMVGAVTCDAVLAFADGDGVGVDETGRAGDDGGGVLAVETVEVAGPEGARQGTNAGDGVGEELLCVILDALGAGVVDEHLGGHAADVGAGAAVHVLGLLDEDHALAGVGERVSCGLAALAESDDENVGAEVGGCGFHAVESSRAMVEPTRPSESRFSAQRVSHGRRQSRHRSGPRRCRVWTSAACLGAGTRMDVAAHGSLQAPFHVLLEGTLPAPGAVAAVLDLVPGDVVVIPSGAPHRVVTAGRGTAQGIAEATGDAFTTTRSERRRPSRCSTCSAGTTRSALAPARCCSGACPIRFRSRSGGPPTAMTCLRMLSALMRGEAQREGDGTAAILSALSTVLLTMVLRTSRGASDRCDAVDRGQR